MVVKVETNIYQFKGDFSINCDFTWRVSDCEELVAPHEWNNYVPN